MNKFLKGTRQKVINPRQSENQIKTKQSLKMLFRMHQRIKKEFKTIEESKKYLFRYK